MQEEFKKKLDNLYEELHLAFKAIHDEYVDSDSFKNWAAAKKAWEETESYKKKINMHVISEMNSSEDWKIYLHYYHSSTRAYPSYGHNIQCPGHSKPQEKFDLKRKLLLLEYGLPSDTKLPSEWYWDGYEWDWS